MTKIIPFRSNLIYPFNIHTTCCNQIYHQHKTLLCECKNILTVYYPSYNISLELPQSFPRIHLRCVSWCIYLPAYPIAFRCCIHTRIIYKYEAHFLNRLQHILSRHSLYSISLTGRAVGREIERGRERGTMIRKLFFVNNVRDI